MKNGVDNFRVDRVIIVGSRIISISYSNYSSSIICNEQDR